MDAETELERLYAMGLRFRIWLEGNRFRVTLGDYMKEPLLEGFFPSFDDAVEWLRTHAVKLEC